MPSLVSSTFQVLSLSDCSPLCGAAAASAQGINPALKDLAAAANKEGSLTLSWSGSTFAGIQGAARYQAAINKMFGTNIRVNFLPGPDMARIANQLATEFTAKPARARRPRCSAPRRRSRRSSRSISSSGSTGSNICPIGSPTR